MKHWFAFGILITIFFFLIPSIAEAESQSPNEIVWDNSTIPSPLPNVINSNLIIKDGTNISSPTPLFLTINGSLSIGSSGQLTSIHNLNIIVNSASQKSSIENLELGGSLTFTNSEVVISKTFAKNPLGTALVFSNSNFNIAESEISDSDIGILADHDSTGKIISNNIFQNGIGLKIDTSQAVNINDNNIYQNHKTRLSAEDQDQQFGLDNLSIDQIDASNNWWGCSSGPIFDRSSLDCDGISNDISNLAWFKNFVLRPGELVVNEIFPNPPTSDIGSEPTLEWFEIYNKMTLPSDIQLFVSDKSVSSPMKTSSPIPTKSCYIIAANKENVLRFYPELKLTPDKVFNLNHSIGSGLNNTSADKYLSPIDSVTINYLQQDNLSDPFTIMISSLSYGQKDGICSGDPQENFSCSRFGEESEWTSIPTPAAENKKTPLTPTPPQEIIQPIVDTIQQPITPICPTTIKINEAPNYYNCQVTITAKIRRSYGTYFYIYDETGDLKVYLQASKKIKKPRLTANLPVKITGIIDNYRTGLRLLPQSSADIQVINLNKSDNQLKTSQSTPKLDKAATSDETTATSVPQIQQTKTEDILSIPQAKAQVKGIQDVPKSNNPAHLPLKIALICAMMLLIAVYSYNLGLKHGND